MKKHALIVVVEGLGTNLLGAYGSGLCTTPALDRLAARSLIFDQCWLDSLDLESLYRSMWFGWHAFEAPQVLGKSCMQWLQEYGVESSLATNSVSMQDWLGAAHFDSLLHLELFQNDDEFKEVEDDHTLSQSEWTESGISSSLIRAIDAWEAFPTSSSLHWIHLRGLMGPWDAPYSWREALGDEDDPPPPQGTTPPNMLVDDSTDPDLKFGWARAAAAQAMLLDQAWQWVESSLVELGIRDSTMVVFMGTQGYPLGEHQIIGPEKRWPFAETCHIPLVIQPGFQLPLSRRVNSIVQPADLWRSILDWFEIDTDNDPRRRCSSALQTESAPLAQEQWLPKRQIGFGFDQQKCWLRTPAWYAVGASPDVHESNFQLFVHPEDRWQQNDVCMRASKIAKSIEQTMLAVQQWLRNEGEIEPPELAIDLISMP